jgi:hypothetical protein
MKEEIDSHRTTLLITNLCVLLRGGTTKQSPRSYVGDRFTKNALNDRKICRFRMKSDHTEDLLTMTYTVH